MIEIQSFNYTRSYFTIIRTPSSENKHIIQTLNFREEIPISLLNNKKNLIEEEKIK